MSLLRLTFAHTRRWQITATNFIPVECIYHTQGVSKPPKVHIEQFSQLEDNCLPQANQNAPCYCTYDVLS